MVRGRRARKRRDTPVRVSNLPAPRCKPTRTCRNLRDRRLRARARASPTDIAARPTPAPRDPSARSCQKRGWSQTGPLHQAADNLFGREKLFGNLPCRAAVTGVITLDRVHGGENVVHRSEAKQAIARRQELAEAGFLRDDRAAGGEVTTGAVAEPAGVRADVLIARHGEFAARLLDVLPVEVGIAGDFQ